MYSFETPLWRWEAQQESAWFFLTVPGDISDDIEARMAGRLRGFGSVRVRVTVGTTTWSTSVFPDKQREAYVLPVKKQVRTENRIGEGDIVSVTLTLVDD